MRWHRVLIRTLICSAILLTAVAHGPTSAHAAVTAVKGSAYGYLATNITLFGGPQAAVGPTPSVTLPAAGAALPITATALTGSVQYGPGRLFSSGPISVSTQGTTGPTGSVTSSTSIATVNTSGQEVFTASNVSSTCTALESGVTGSTTITSGTLQTDSGDDTPGDVHSPVTVSVPTNPAPNTTILGHIHPNGAQDSFRYVFNEQIVNPDGSLTVNAAHQYFLGPTLVGDLIIGQSVCGATAATTAATFRSLTATAARDGVLVRWRTASELDLLGFNVYRAVNGHRVRVNQRLIRSRGRGAYSLLDRMATRAKAARYWIQAVNLDGSRSWYGPARVTARLS